MAFRRHVWSLGLGVAEAMDTAQRGMGMDWPNSLELIRRSLDAAKDFPGAERIGFRTRPKPRREGVYSRNSTSQGRPRRCLRRTAAGDEVPLCAAAAVRAPK